ncbi:MAG: hypothetical protein J6B98_01090 [Bacilli bacterium]|nr:hypothetical protein [Bacilli bacterium]
MKKMNFILLVLLLFILNIQSYEAAFTMCEYKLNHTIDDCDGDTCFEQKSVTETIKVFYDNNKYTIETPNDCGRENWQCASRHQMNAKTLYEMYTTESYYRFSPSAYEDMQNGICPSEAYYDLIATANGHSGIIEVCFGDRTYCGSKDEGDDSGSAFVQEEFEGFNSTITTTSSNVTDYLTSIVDKAYDAGLAEAKKVVIDKNVKYQDNETCASFVKDPTGFTETIIKKANDGAKKYSLNYFSQNQSQNTAESLSNLVVNRIEKNTPFNVSDVVKKIETDCNSLIESSSATQSEKENWKNKLKEAFNVSEKVLTDYSTSASSYEFKADFGTEESCAGFLGDKSDKSSPAYYLDLIMKIFKYAAVILALVLSVIEFLKATVSQDKDLLQKAIMSSVKRLVFAVIIFFLPIAINFFLGLIGAYSSCV